MKSNRIPALILKQHIFKNSVDIITFLLGNIFTQMHRRSTFSGIVSDVSSPFTSQHSLSTRSQASGTCWDAEDYVEDTTDTNTIGHIRICNDHLYP